MFISNRRPSASSSQTTEASTPDKAQNLLELSPLMRSYDGALLKMWDSSRAGAVAGLLQPSGDLYVVSTSNVKNGLQPNESGPSLLRR